MASNSMSLVTLKASDDVLVTATRRAAEKSVIIRDMLSDLDDAVLEGAIPIFNVAGATLEQVVGWCERHAADAEPSSAKPPPPPPLDDDDNNNNNNLTDEDRAFLGALDTREGLLEVILAANYLDIKDLLDQACRTVADRLSGKSTQQMREILGVENDFDPAEEEQLRKDNAWAFDYECK
ncbi:Skp1 family, dimerization domain-containing protein [Xylariomycetidae sp. FL0641]|nr:Skp1 family, dimerization domain-containing protein [Xylariomycetidae sp. FL0641]